MSRSLQAWESGWVNGPEEETAYPEHIWTEAAEIFLDNEANWNEVCEKFGAPFAAIGNDWDPGDWIHDNYADLLEDIIECDSIDLSDLLAKIWEEENEQS